MSEPGELLSPTLHALSVSGANDVVEVSRSRIDMPHATALTYE